MSMKLKVLLKPVAVAVLALGLGPAYAAATYCSSGSPHPDGLSVNDVSFQAGTQPSSSSSDCYGVVQTANSTEKTEILQWTDDSYTWSHVLSTDGSPSGVYETLRLTISGDGFDGTTSGSWNLTWEDTDTSSPLNLPTSIDLIVALKASNRYALYLFEDLYLEAAPDNEGTGTWKISFQNHGLQIPELSHLEIFAGQGTVPEPGTLLLLGSGLLALSAGRKRVS